MQARKELSSPHLGGQIKQTRSTTTLWLWVCSASQGSKPSYAEKFSEATEDHAVLPDTAKRRKKPRVGRHSFSYRKTWTVFHCTHSLWDKENMDHDQCCHCKLKGCFHSLLHKRMTEGLTKQLNYYLLWSLYIPPSQKDQNFFIYVFLTPFRGHTLS